MGAKDFRESNGVSLMLELEDLLAEIQMLLTDDEIVAEIDAACSPQYLFAIMDDLSDEAAYNGLTPQILASILQNE